MNQVRDLMEALADSPAPASTVDIDLARRRGRRTVLLRRVGVAGSAAAAVLAVVITVGAVAYGPTGVGPSPAPAGTGPRPTATAVALAPEKFDAMTQYADFGWLPDGGPESRQLSTGVDWMRLDAAYPTPPEAKDPRYVSLSVVSGGHGIDPTLYEGFAISERKWAEQGDALLETAPVNGRPAKWVENGAGSPAIAWEYAPHAWAMVSLHGEWDDSKDLVRQIAAGVRLGVDRPILLPFTVRGVPGSLEPRSVTVSRGPGSDVWGALVCFGATDARPASGDWPLTIQALASDRRSGDDSVLGDPNTTLDGYPARTSTHLDGGKALQVFDVDGVFLELSTHTPETTASLDGGLEGLFRSMTIHRDPRSWE
jgi:hypothetical protein